MYSQTPDQLIIKIVGSQSGSGIIYFPQAHPDIVLVFTAWHCIEGTSLSGLRLTLGNQTGYQCPDDGNHHILSFEEKEGENDLAILVIPRQSFPMAEPAQQFEFLNDFFDLNDGWAVGFPNANDGLKKLRGEFRQFKPEMPNCFEASTQREDLTTLISDGYENVEGMSGGGFFMESGGVTYLAGILFRFKENYKDFVCIKVGKLNELLVVNGYHPLPYSFANSLGMNAQWFDRHIQRSIEDLGDRYTQEIPNFDVPIAQYFDGLSRGKVFKEHVKGYFHKFLIVLQKDGNLHRPEEMNMATYFGECYSNFYKIFEEIDWGVTGDLRFEELMDEVDKIEKKADYFQNQIHHLRYLQREKLPVDKREHASLPYDSEAYHLRQVMSAIHDFKRELWGGTMQLAQTACLLLHGKAGYGKSHLLGDIAAQKRKKELPAMLVLGNKLRGEQNVWRQIQDELGLVCDTDTFLTTLDSVGQHMGERVLFMIDALNEGRGKEFWKDSLAGFIHEVNKYPFIGLVLAVRDTYLDIVVPETLTKNNNIVKVAHNGFGGNELNAVKHFCRFFQLEQPRFPILSPEFSNPQLLLLLCRSLRDSGKKAFPEGLNGITSIYENYLDAVNRKVSIAIDCQPRLKLVQSALKHLAETIAEEGNGAIELLSAERIFNQFHPKYGSELFRELTREGTLHEDREWKHEQHSSVDVVRFNYERFGDFIAAQYLLEKHINPKKPKAAFQSKGFFRSYFSERYYDKLGILETMAVLLPELYKVELLEAFSSQSLSEKQFGDYAASAFINSLLWRDITSIDSDKIRETCLPHIKKRHLVEQFHGVLLHLAPIPGHPYNADLIHRLNIQLSMAKLDSVWSPFILDAFVEEESAIHRLLMWIWSDFDLSTISDESRRLTATILAWLLPSSNIPLRDTATLSLVRLLSGYPDTTAQVLNQFEKVKDVYVQERLYSVAFGVITNSGEHPGIAQLAQCVYDQVFKEGVPPTHILLRDYARSVVEYALHLGFPINVDAERIRPPYGSSLPPSFPSDEEIAQYKIDLKSEEYKKNPQRLRAQHDIEYSALSWDFFTYVISSEMRYFHSVAIPFQKEYLQFKQKPPRGTKRLFKILEENSPRLQLLSRKKAKDEHVAVLEKMASELCEMVSQAIERKMTASQKEVFRSKILPHLSSLNEVKATGRSSTIDPHPVARWIFKRVFELGWDAKLHGDFDKRHGSHGREDGKRTERIGKKYQWIALHEILAIIADNHWVSDWGDNPEPYQGTWEPFVRKIDPTYPCLDNDSVFHQPSPIESWWLHPKYDKWDVENWLNRTDDLPNPLSLFELKDNNQCTWISLLSMPNWELRGEFGVHEWDSGYRNLWYHLRGYLIKQSSADKAFEWLSKQHFMGRWMPEEAENYQVFDREYYWSPAYKSFEAEAQYSYEDEGYLWRKFKGSPYKGIVPVEKYGAGGGSFKCQGGYIKKPAKFLWQGLKLKNGKRPGECINENGEIVCFDPAVGTNKSGCLLIRKDILMDFLQKNQLVLCWTLLGEKLIRQKPMASREFFITEFSGAYRLKSNGEIEGGLRVVKER